MDYNTIFEPPPGIKKNGFNMGTSTKWATAGKRQFAEEMDKTAS